MTRRSLLVIDLYQGDIATLSDAEIGELLAEIEDSGVLLIEYPDDEGRQIQSRLTTLLREQRRRWELAHPEEAARERTRGIMGVFAAKVEHYRHRLNGMFERDERVFTAIKDGAPIAPLSPSEFVMPIRWKK